MQERLTRFNSIVAFLIKEARLIRRIPLSFISSNIAKSISYISKIENGKSTISVDMIDAISRRIFQIHPSIMIGTAERYADYLFSKGLNIDNMTSESEYEIDKDFLIVNSKEFYNSESKSESGNYYQNPYYSSMKCNNNIIDIWGTPYLCYEDTFRPKYIVSPFFQYIIQVLENNRSQVPM